MSYPHVTVVGAGHVGATCAYLLALKGLADVTLIDIVDGLAAGKALDMFQSAPIEAFPGTVRGTTDYEAMRGSRLVVITAGEARKPGMSRDDLLAANAKIVGPIVERVADVAHDAIIIVVTNPLDIMVAFAIKRSGFKRQHVMGMAPILDSARLRAFVAAALNVPPADVQAMVLGSHGDLMVPLRGSITVRGESISNKLRDEEIDQLLQRTRDGGAEIVKLLKHGSAYYAPASGVAKMAQAILQDTHEVMPVCVALEGEYGMRDVCLGVPAELGANGIERVVEMELTPNEHQALAASAEKVRDGIKSLMAMQGHF